MPIFAPIRRRLSDKRRNGAEQAPLAGMRWQLLGALRSLSVGAVLIVQADPATAEPEVVVFEGQPQPQLIGRVLLTHRWIEPNRAHWMAHSSFYRLSPLGMEALEAGLHWWRSLPFRRRLLLRLME